MFVLLSFWLVKNIVTLVRILRNNYLVGLFLVCADWSYRSGSSVVRARVQGVVEEVEGVLHLQIVEVEVVGLRSLVAEAEGLAKSWGVVGAVAGHVTWWKYETLRPLWQ